MHFHDSSRCLHCKARRVYATPIPNILLLSSMCESCGFNDLVGWTGESLCYPCVDMWREDVNREMHRDLRTSFPPDMR